MHEIEPISFCTIEEYNLLFPDRVTEQELSIDGLYMALARLRDGEKDKRVFKFPVRLLALDLDSQDTANVCLGILDADLLPVGEVDLRMINGVAKETPLHEVSTEKKLTELFLRNYKDDAPLGLTFAHDFVPAEDHNLVLA